MSEMIETTCNRKVTTSKILSTALILVQWCIIAACIGCLSHQGISCIEKYLSKDTRFIQTLIRSKDITFIAFTVCPSYHDAYKDKVLELYGTNKDAYKKGNL